jgi:hypothetical protein
MHRHCTHCDKNSVNLSELNTHFTGYVAGVTELCLVFTMYVVHAHRRQKIFYIDAMFLSVFDLEAITTLTLYWPGSKAVAKCSNVCRSQFPSFTFTHIWKF